MNSHITVLDTVSTSNSWSVSSISTEVYSKLAGKIASSLANDWLQRLVAMPRGYKIVMPDFPVHRHI